MKRFTALAVALAMLAGPSAFAQPYDHGPPPGGPPYGGDHGPPPRGDRDDHRDHDRDRHGRYDRYDQYRHDERHEWRRGERFEGPSVIVRDYHRHDLRRPPRGYHWVRNDDGTYLLVAISTGLILDLILNSR